MHAAPDVTVSPLVAADEADFVAAVRASRALHRPWIDLADSHERFAAVLERLSRDDQEAYLLRHHCDALVGYVRVSNVVYGAFRSACLGYGAFAGHEGRGLMTRGLQTVIDLAFSELGLHRVEANNQPSNARSLALVQRLGFSREGFSPNYLMVDGAWRDHERWALRNEAIEARPSASGRVEAPSTAGGLDAL
ncbi:MAG TPA: GNAT family N-acetyltransferase [Acidimicrobiales bacterium]|nr:GNAT family N-acetyltransferase [Acidimicrobiales bacterium]